MRAVRSPSPAIVRRRRAARLGAALLLLAGAAQAQQVQLRVGREPYYVGVPIDVHVHATGFERSPDPRCEVADPSTGTLTLRGIAPNVSSRVQVINGRVTREENVTYTCQYQFAASAPGPVTLGPFRVVQGATTRQTEPLALRIAKVPVDDRVRLRLRLPDEPVFLGQHVPVTIEWWVAEELRDRISQYAIRSLLFASDETFRFIDDPPAQRGQQSLAIETPDGALELGATLTERRWAGTDYLVISATRTLVPLRSGDFDLGAATVQVDEVVDWQRDLFGRRTARRTRKLLGRDTARTLVVKAPPRDGRPASYAGAVGRGFSLEVTADRSVVQLGDPITLELTLRGDGNLDSAGLPDLTGPGGLDPEQFRTPSEDVSGRVEGDAKTFRVGVRVMDDGVREIPALEYTWFDPHEMTYQTTQSRPIALSVRPAEVISAGDVVSARPGADAEPDDAAPRAPDAEEGPAHRSGSIRMTGADLSLVRDEDALLRGPGDRLALRASLYGAGVALVLAALWQRRRSDVAPEVARRRALLEEQKRRIAAAHDLPERDGLREIAAALRELAAGAPEVRDDALDELVRECEAVLYDPAAGGGERVSPERLARADALLDRAAREIG